MATTDPTFEDRIAELEARITSLQLGDLPLAALQRKLENDWQPDANVLLQPNSITGDQIAARTVAMADVAQPLVWGEVTGAGVLGATGGGVSVVRNAVGKYTLTFNPVFASGVGCVAMTRGGGANATANIAQRTDVANNGTTYGLWITDPASAAFQDIDFSFIAIGIGK
jgi:hypothetical protein